MVFNTFIQLPTTLHRIVKLNGLCGHSKTEWKEHKGLFGNKSTQIPVPGQNHPKHHNWHLSGRNNGGPSTSRIVSGTSACQSTEAESRSWQKSKVQKRQWSDLVDFPSGSSPVSHHSPRTCREQPPLWWSARVCRHSDSLYAIKWSSLLRNVIIDLTVIIDL